MKASEAVVAWGGFTPGVYVAKSDESILKDCWKLGKISAPVCGLMKYRHNLTEAENLELALLYRFHDLTLFRGLPAKDVVREFLKIDEYRSLFYQITRDSRRDHVSESR